jgi:DNA polymerase-3 subunit delta'
MLNDLILHRNTKDQLNRFIEAPSHAILLAGPAGGGKTTTARMLAEAILDIEDFDSYPYGLTISRNIDKKLIMIDDARKLESFLSLKVLNKKTINRIVIIEEAHKLSLPAQNALLKTMEEPPNGSLLILTTNSEQNLLPTVRSRLQVVHIHKPDKADLRANFAQISEPRFNQIYSISGGLPGLLHALVNDEEHPLIEATKIARQILSGTTYDRLSLIDSLNKNRELANNSLSILQQMAEISLVNANESSTKRWKKVLEASYLAADELNRNVQTKLVLLNLMFSL